MTRTAAAQIVKDAALVAYFRNDIRTVAALDSVWVGEWLLTHESARPIPNLRNRIRRALKVIIDEQAEAARWGA